MSRMSTLLSILALLLVPLAARALSTAFTYQGRLTQAGAAPTGSYDFRFVLFDAAIDGVQVGPTLWRSGVNVVNGLFTATLDFGAAPFAGDPRWLQVDVRVSGGTSYAPLAPRQPLAPAPYALYAGTVDWSGIVNRPADFGIYTAGDGLGLAGQEFSVAFAGTGAAITAARSDHQHDSVYWRQGGNAFGTTGILGTTDNYALEIKVNNSRVLRLAQGTYAPNITFGHPDNSIDASVYAGTIGGGGYPGYPNTVTNDFGTVAGGYGNAVGGSAGTVSGGYRNVVSGNFSAIAGGRDSQVSGGASFIGSGYSNDASGSYASIAGGYSNVVTGNYGTVPGGAYCSAGSYAFAAGYRAKAASSGSFVLADYQGADITAPAANTFTVRAAGGIWLGTGSSPSIPSGRFLNTSTGGYLTTGGAWTNACDRSLKTDFAAIQGSDILRALAALPITEWRYKAGTAGERHLGPTAQDFRAAFGLGLDDVSISTVDGIGVALAAAQALGTEHAALQARTARLEAENADLKARLAKLEAAMTRLAEQQ